jgi:hypothetical protein
MNHSFKAIAYMAPIKQWAMANGIKFFTWKDQLKAIARYEIFQAIKN